MAKRSNIISNLILHLKILPKKHWTKYFFVLRCSPTCIIIYITNLLKFKKMNENLIVSSVLLLAVPQLCNGRAYNVLPDLQIGFKNKVGVVVLNCEEKANIKGFLSQTVNELAAGDPSIELFNKVLQTMDIRQEEPVDEKLETTLERNYCVTAQPHKTIFLRLADKPTPSWPFN